MHPCKVATGLILIQILVRLYILTPYFRLFLNSKFNTNYNRIPPNGYMTAFLQCTVVCRSPPLSKWHGRHLLFNRELLGPLGTQGLSNSIYDYFKPPNRF